MWAHSPIVKFVVDRFNDPKAEDAQKAAVVTCSHRYWRSIKDEVRQFLAEK